MSPEALLIKAIGFVIFLAVVAWLVAGDKTEIKHTVGSNQED